jgi:nitronate monooxygenase
VNPTLQTDAMKQLNLRFPIIMAPMFLVSNEQMMQSAIRNGIMGCFPTLNYRKEHELEHIINNLHLEILSRNGAPGNFGVNLIVQKSNPLYKKHLDVCIARKVPFYITSLGNPEEVINRAHEYGAKVYCDVTNLAHAEKCAKLNCDGYIAVGAGAGGHAGPHPNYILIPALKKAFPHIPVMAAGGIATGEAILSMLACGASGVSIGTRFIASEEAGVPQDYKKAVVEYGMEDIIMTERLSGTPCAVINTPSAKKLGTRQNFFERYLSRNPRTKKYFKMLVNVRGLQKLEQAVKPGNYSNLWCAGQSVEMVHDIKSCDAIINDLEKELAVSWELLKGKVI